MKTARQRRALDDTPEIGDALDWLTHSHPEDRRIMPIALCIALCLHVLALLINFPEMTGQTPTHQNKKIIVVRKYIPPPPKVERPRAASSQKRSQRRIPIPDPTPDEPEPIREPEPEIVPEPLPPDVEFVIGVPEPPPPSEPVIAGVGDVTNPTRIEESFVRPEYPEIARVARVTGQVILQAVIQRDGTVAESKVMRCTRPGFGFEDAAIAAVEQWRYRPATQNGRPVDCYFTIIVDFSLSSA